MDTDLARVARDSEVAVVTINNPPVNALGAELVRALTNAVDEVERDPEAKAVVLIGAGRGFFPAQWDPKLGIHVT